MRLHFGTVLKIIVVALLLATTVNFAIENAALKLLVADLETKNQAAEKQIETMQAARSETEPEQEEMVEPNQQSEINVTAPSKAVARGTPIPIPADAIHVSRAWVNRILGADFQKTLNDATAAPHFVSGKLRGFKLTNVRAGSVYESVGLRDQDLVEAINGVRLNDAGRAVQTLNAFRNASLIRLTISRNGARQNLHIAIK